MFGRIGAAMLALGCGVANAAEFVFVDTFEAAPDCSVPLACPVPSSGKTCIAGQLAWAGSNAPIRAFIEPLESCSGAALGGACELQVRAYDAIALATDPSSAIPLPAVESTLDGCGRFRLSNLDRPASGVVAVVADDLAGSGDDVLAAARVRAIASNERVDNLALVAVSRAVDAQWTQSAGSPFGGSTFGGVGSALMRFLSAGVPVAGVTITRNGNPVPTQDYYFAGAYAVDANAASTNASGEALVANVGSPATYSGNGGPSGCTWPGAVLGSAPGLIVVAELTCSP